MNVQQTPQRRFRRKALPTAGQDKSHSRLGIILAVVSAAVIVPAVFYTAQHPENVGSAVTRMARHMPVMKSLRVAVVAQRETPPPSLTPAPSPTPAAPPTLHPKEHHAAPPALAAARAEHLKREKEHLRKARRLASAGSVLDVAGSAGTTAGTSADHGASASTSTATAAPSPAAVAMAQTPQADATPIYAPDVIVDARFTHEVRPEYPEIARMQNAQGTAIVLATIGPDGKVISARIEQSTGNKMLDAAALTAAEQSGFEPPMINGKPATETYRLVYTFTP